MSFQYGLNVIPSERDQFYYRELAPQQDSLSSGSALATFEALYTNIITFFGITPTTSSLSTLSCLGSISSQVSFSNNSNTSV